jgi:uncharacterized protein YbjT (DUF2867 family)
MLLLLTGWATGYCTVVLGEFRPAPPDSIELFRGYGLVASVSTSPPAHAARAAAAAATHATEPFEWVHPIWLWGGGIAAVASVVTSPPLWNLPLPLGLLLRPLLLLLRLLRLLLTI